MWESAWKTLIAGISLGSFTAASKQFQGNALPRSKTLVLVLCPTICIPTMTVSVVNRLSLWIPYMIEARQGWWHDQRMDWIVASSGRVDDDLYWNVNGPDSVMMPLNQVPSAESGALGHSSMLNGRLLQRYMLVGVGALLESMLFGSMCI